MTQKKIRWMIDALEEDMASVEQGTGAQRHVPRFLLPAGVKEGDICQVSVDSQSAESVTVTVSIDHSDTDAAKNRSAAQLAATPPSKDPGGPIKL
jgi:hypothetical protein